MLRGLWYVPGSHKKVSPVTKHMVRNPLYDRSDPDCTESMLVFEGDEYPVFPEEQWVSAPCKKGSLVLIHGQVRDIFVIFYLLPLVVSIVIEKASIWSGCSLHDKKE